MKYPSRRSAANLLRISNIIKKQLVKTFQNLSKPLPCIIIGGDGNIRSSGFISEHPHLAYKAPGRSRAVFLRLRSIVKNREFNADLMGGHMRQFILARHRSNPHYDEVIRYYVAAAWAVSRYLS